MLSLLLAAVLFLPTLHALDVEWYISANGSDEATCGRSAANPCRSLESILSYSPSFSNASTTCYLSVGAVDSRDSTVLYFLGEINTVPPICLRNWTNIRIVGLHNNSTLLTDRTIGGCRGIFEFELCTNVTIENINFGFSGIGRATLFLEASRDIRVSGCTFPVTAQGSRGLWLRQCAGDITLSNNVFYGNEQQLSEPRTARRALEVLHGCVDESDCTRLSYCVMPFDMEPYEFANLSFTLNMAGCIFRDLTGLQAAVDDYSSARRGAVAMRLQFGSYSINNQVFVRNTSFSNIINTEANGIAVNYLGRALSNMASSNNTVLFSNCSFRENDVRYGGGLSAYFISGPVYSTLMVEDCEFTDNIADFEGGAIFAVFLSSGSTNTLSATNSVFRRNSAGAGGGVFVLNNAQWFSTRGVFDLFSRSVVVQTSLTDCLFEGNRANVSKGIIEVLRVQLNVNGISNFTGSVGSAILLRLSFLNMAGEFTFSNNAGIAGGAISIRDGSRANLTAVSKGFFLNNSAAFHGGAIFADQDSTTELVTEYIHTSQLLFSSCFILFGNEIRTVTERNPRRFTFIGNEASFEGQHVHSFSLRSCVSSNFVPAAVDRFFAFPNDGTVYIEVPPNRDPLQSTTTGSNFLFFYGSSVKCLKKVGNITYLLPNCSNALLKSTFYRLSDLSCGISSFIRELRTIYDLPGSGLRPTSDTLIAPWASIDSSWMKPPEDDRKQCPEPNPGNLVISPAPGEQFDISILLADQLLNYVSATIYVKLEGIGGGFVSALLQLNGLQFGVGDRIYFTPNRPLAGLAIVGMPGARGILRITAESQIQGQPVVLRIPFHLAGCPLGYFPPPTLRNATAASELVYKSVTQRIPTDPYQPLACHCFQEDTSLVTFSSLIREIESECILGYTVQLSSANWGGLISKDGDPIDDQYPSSVPCPALGDGNETTFSDNLTNFVLEIRRKDFTNHELNFDPVDVVPYLGLIGPGGGAPVMCFEKTVSEVINHKSKGIFTIEQCGQGYCRGDVRDTWLVANVSYPCADNRMGPLCGQCKPNHAVTLYSTHCTDCSGKDYQYYLSLVFTLTFGLVLVIVVLGFNIGATPTFDSFLFFIQSVYLMLAGRNDYEVFNFLAFFNPNFTFNLCITPNLTALSRLILQYVTPTYILLLLCFILIFTKFKFVSRILGRHSILQGLWLLFLISYFNITITSFEILYCRRVGPVALDGVGEHRDFYLTQDPSVRCFQGLHLLFTIIAIAILLVFIVPVPVYLFVIMRKVRWKPIADVFCSYYSDNRRWWIIISLLRRFLLVLLGVFIQDVGYRHFFLLINIILILICQVVTWPYKTLIDNTFAVYVIWKLLIVAVITQPQLYLDFDLYRVPSFILVILTILIGLFLIVQEILIRLLGKKSVGRFYKSKVWPRVRKYKKRMSKDLRAKKSFELEESTKSNASAIIHPKYMIDATAYREPLLDSQYSGSVEDSQFTKWEDNAATSSSMKVSLSENRNPSYFFKKKKFDEPQQIPDEDEETSEYEPPSVTEIVTGDGPDSGLATSRTTGSQKPNGNTQSLYTS